MVELSTGIVGEVALSLQAPREQRNAHVMADGQLLRRYPPAVPSHARSALRFCGCD